MDTTIVKTFFKVIENLEKYRGKAYNYLSLNEQINQNIYYLKIQKFFFNLEAKLKDFNIFTIIIACFLIFFALRYLLNVICNFWDKISKIK